MRPGLSPKTVARFDAVLNGIVAHWPQPVFVGDESDGSLNTIAARLRDAIKAVCDGIVPHPSAERLRTIRDQLVVSINGQNVMAGPRPSKVPAPLASRVEKDYFMRIDDPSDAEVTAVVSLALGGRFPGPVLLGVGVDHPQLAQVSDADVFVSAVSSTSTSIM